MLYHLLYPLKEIFIGFNVFRYITFRAAMASISAFLISVIFGPLLIRKLAIFKMGESIRKDESPELFSLHRQKRGTPSMGGLLIILAMVSSVLLWADLTNKYVILTILATVWLGILGFIDDYQKWVKKKSWGLSASRKLLGQILLGLILGLFIYLNPETSKILDVPFFKKLLIDLGVFYIPFAILVIVGSSNAVNLTDGLDGLAIGCVIMVGLAYAGLSYVTGHVKFSNYLLIPYVAGTGELAIFCASVVGAGLGFLWFNSHPATIFMGDTGSLTLGGVIGTVALFIKKELLLLLVGGIFVAEAISVILQVASFRLRGKRIFLISPLHHHFQLKGWPESKITVRFWIVAAILALLSLTTLKLR